VEVDVKALNADIDAVRRDDRAAGGVGDANDEGCRAGPDGAVEVKAAAGMRPDVEPSVDVGRARH